MSDTGHTCPAPWGCSWSLATADLEEGVREAAMDRKWVEAGLATWKVLWVWAWSTGWLLQRNLAVW